MIKIGIALFVAGGILSIITFVVWADLKSPNEYDPGYFYYDRIRYSLSEEEIEKRKILEEKYIQQAFSCVKYLLIFGGIVLILNALFKYVALFVGVYTGTEVLEMLLQAFGYVVQ